MTARVRSTTGGYVFTSVCLLTLEDTPSPPHNTSNHWSHILSVEVPQYWQEGYPSPRWGYPSPRQGVPLSCGIPLAKTGLGAPPQSRRGLGYPPPGQDCDTPQPGLGVLPLQDRLHLAMLRHRRYSPWVLCWCWLISRILTSKR